MRNFEKDAQLLSAVRRCVQNYNMIEDGDKIAVGVSGGKDSSALLCALALMRRFLFIRKKIRKRKDVKMR